MTLLRAAARTMLASYFVASGVKALRDPESLVPAAEPVADRLVPMVKKFAPDQVAGYVPEDAKTLVRLNGGAQVFGGLALATGKGRRLGAILLAGSLIPSTIAKHNFWSESDPEAKAASRSHFLKNVSLLGGVLIASRDTEGQPSIAWRAQKGGQSLAKDTRKAAKKLSKSSSGAGDTASNLADGAMAGGAALVGAVVASSRKARKAAAKQLEDRQKAADQAAKQAKKDAPRKAKEAKKAAKQAKKDAPKQLKAAKKQAAEQAEQAREDAKIAEKEGRKRAKAAEKKKSKKIRGNISLGEN